MERPAGFFRLRPLDVDLGDVLVQIVAVALGVILGFAATQWNERNHERALFRDTAGNIVAELRSNRSGLREVMAQHAAGANVLDGLLARAGASAAISLGDARVALHRTGDFRENIPLSIAWQIAQSDQGLTLLPYDRRYDLAWIYELQTIYFQKEERYEGTLLTFQAPPGGNYFFAVLDLDNQLKSVVSTERQLDATYSSALAQAAKEFPT